MKFVGLGAAASMVSICALAERAHATPVAVQSVQWEFYQGGSMLHDNGTFDLIEETYANLPVSVVEATTGGASFMSSASILNSTVNGTDSFSFSTFADLHAEASILEGTQTSSANAFSTLSIYSVEFLVSDAPHLYTGELVLEGANGPVMGGELLEPGLYSYFYLNTLGLDSSITAGPAQSLTSQSTREFHFEFSAVPTPSAAVLAAPALALALRRRR